LATKKTSRLAGAISSALVLAFALSAEAQTTRRVPLDYPTIQSAINAAISGDTVLVAPGTYVENINFAGKAIIVTSEGGPEVTLIDGNRADSVVKFISGEPRAAVLNGFTLLNGRSGFDSQGFGEGGGIWITQSSPTVSGNIIANNRACNGLAISAWSSSPLIRGNSIINNVREGCSGGTGGAVIIGGVSAAEIVDNVIAGNVLPGDSSGGITLWAASNPIIRGNIIKGNSAGDAGGGMWIANGSDAVIAQNVITGNKAASGAGIYVLVAAGSKLRLVNNTIADNHGARGSGIYVDGSDSVAELHNNVIAAEYGWSAVYCGNLDRQVQQTPIFRSNNVFAQGAPAFDGFCSVPTGSNGNISADPLFVAPTAGDYRLQQGSPSMDAGDGAAPQLPSRDADGNARIIDGGSGVPRVDMGAYERGVVLSPAFHDFGAAVFGAAPPAPAVFSIANPGPNVLSIASISIGSRSVGAGGQAAFAVGPGGPNPCPDLAPTLAPGQSCSVVVSFAAPEFPGEKGATLRVVSDATGSPTLASLLASAVAGTSITTLTPQRTISLQASFTFSSNLANTTFECKLDNQAAFTACSSPMEYTTVRGTHTFQVRAVSRLGDRAPPASYTWTVALRARFDFSGDGRADIVWRNALTGQNYLYPMNGTAILGSEGYLRTVADLNWRVAGLGDFDGDGKADILWRNTSTGQNYIYFMDGAAIKPTEGYIRTVADQNWQVAGIGDFDGDGKDDILWRNAATGENYVYPMNGLSIKAGEGYVRTLANLDWKIVAVADFDGDGRADILWRNSASGENYLYPMAGTAIKPSEGFLRTVADQNWKVAGVGDLDGDGKADIVWRNADTGENYVYPMEGRTIKPSEGYLRTVSDLNWQIAALGDYDGDAKSDLLWRNVSTGENYLYPLDGTTIKPTEGYLRSVPDQNWQVQR